MLKLKVDEYENRKDILLLFDNSEVVKVEYKSAKGWFW